MINKHTPGPWKAVRNSVYWEVVPANAGKDDIPFAIGDVCASAPGNPDSGLQEANARLMAAELKLRRGTAAVLRALPTVSPGSREQQCWRSCARRNRQGERHRRLAQGENDGNAEN